MSLHDFLLGLASGALPALVAFMSWLQSIRNTRHVKELSITLNGRLTELLELTKTDAYAAGRSAGIISQKEIEKAKAEAFEVGKAEGIKEIQKAPPGY